jgi:hypothetical protein
MAKKIVGYVKLQVPAGKANPSPPVGPALGQRGLNIMEFCKAFNAQTQKVEPGLPLPVVITAYADKSFSFIIKTPPTAPAHRQGGQDHARAGRGDRPREDAGPHRGRPRGGGALGGRQRAFDGHRRGGPVNDRAVEAPQGAGRKDRP